ncbi:hypothetical protein GBAR_LOCUS27797, partial [Geodia barretti]
MDCPSLNHWRSSSGLRYRDISQLRDTPVALSN